MYYDIHTHNNKENEKNKCRMVSLQAKGDCVFPPFSTAEDRPADYFYSLGIHPWFINEIHLEQDIKYLRKYAPLSEVKAIGECGLDKLCQTNFELQKKVFIEQITISEKIEKPLIIHCVKSFNELITLKKDLKPHQTWIIHGFRGKPEQAKQLILHNFFLSFGPLYHPDTLKETPLNKIFFETDDSNEDISSVYKKAAETLIIPEEKLVRQIRNNVGSVFQF